MDMLNSYNILTKYTMHGEDSLSSKSEIKIQIDPGQKFGFNEAEKLALEILELQDLQSLDFKILENNNFCAKSAQLIANSFSQLKKLKQLSISIYDDNFNSDASLKLGQALSNLSILTGFKIAIGPQNQFGQFGMQGLIQSFKAMSELNSLALCVGTNDIQQYGAKCIGDSLQQLLNLKSLSLQIEKNNNIGTGGAIGIAQGLSALKNLNELQLSIGFDNSISSLGMQSISESIQQINNLIRLSISIGQMNNINREGAFFIAATLKALKNLNFLELIIYDNNIGPEGSKEIGLSIGFLKNLTELQLQIGTNNISDEGALGIGMGLQKLDQLSCLSLKVGLNNNIGPVGAQGLAYGLQYLNNLTKLNLQIASGNNIESQGANEIGKSVQPLRKLYQLSIKIGNNNIKNGFLILFKNIRYLFNLEQIELQIDSKNTINLNEIKIFTSSLISLKTLQQIDIQICSPIALYLIILIKEFKLPQQKLSLKYLRDFKYLTNDESIQNNQQQKPFSLFLSIQIDHEKSLPQSIGLFEGLLTYTHLTSLQLNFGYNNCLSEEGACSLATCISNFLNLTLLNLCIGSFNKISQKGASKIGNSLKGLNNLAQLQIYFGGFNEIQSQGFRSVIDGFSQLSSLRHLEYQVFNSNKINSKDVQYLACAIKSMNHLIKLQIRIIDYQNIYESNCIIALAESISYLSSLRSLSFDLNQWGMFDPNLSFEFCRFIFDLPFLRFLQIGVPSQFKKYTQKIIFRSKRLVVLK
ncbi:hypothetical protein ABPG72_007683 [Tetrahymena utriculariae]